MAGTIRIGVSGWTYPPWRGQFYPARLAQKNELAYAASVLPSIEINGTFYGLQRPQSFAKWGDATPQGFVFAVKAPRFITHMLQLRGAQTALANFLASGPLRLGPKLGPLLWQFPPNFRFDPETFEAFLSILPADTHEAAALASGHDQRLRDRAHLDPGPIRPMRHAVEIRHESFRDPAFVAILRKYSVALVCADTVDWPLLMDLTADFVYCRLHGSQELYNSAYSPAEIDRWSARLGLWARGAPMRDGYFVTGPDENPQPRDVYLYFDNTDKLHAPNDAQALMTKLQALGHSRPLHPSFNLPG